jgi:hypothetical protein
MLGEIATLCDREHYRRMRDRNSDFIASDGGERANRTVAQQEAEWVALHLWSGHH